MNRKDLIDVAAGRKTADVVLRGGQVVDVITCQTYAADVALAGPYIAGIGSYDGKEIVDVSGQYICPGFIDAHVHIESSLLSVPEYCQLVAPRGTIAVITDPHEIANVRGVAGIRYMLESARGCPVQVYVMLSSCVPASHLEGAGATLSADDLAGLVHEQGVLGLAEMMNYPGVVAGDPAVLEKLELCRDRVIDGHCPGLTGGELQAYIAAGIGSDHECTTLEEAREKLRHGLWIMIREGSQARNLEALLPLATPATSTRLMWVTDDKDVEDLITEGHIDHIIRKAIQLGLDPLTAIRMATLSPASYYRLSGLGAVAPGYRASLAVLDDLQQCHVVQTWQDGKLVAREGQCLPLDVPAMPAMENTMSCAPVALSDLAVAASPGTTANVRVIDMIEDQLVTKHVIEELEVVDGAVAPDPQRDLAKLVVIERHHASGRVGVGFIRGFGLKRGSIASTVAHDAHNLVIAGTNDSDILAAARHLTAIGGGLCVVAEGQVLADMPLPIAGLMSAEPSLTACDQLLALHRAAAELGCRQRKPFMGLSFMSLSVIGDLKLTDYGVIDVSNFAPVAVLSDTGR